MQRPPALRGGKAPSQGPSPEQLPDAAQRARFLRSLLLRAQTRGIVGGVSRFVLPNSGQFTTKQCAAARLRAAVTRWTPYIVSLRSFGSPTAA